MKTQLIQDLITFIKEEKQQSFLLTDEEMAFFKKQIKPPPVIEKKAPPVDKEILPAAPTSIQADIVLLFYRQGPRQIAFLKHLTKALSICMGTALLEPAAPAEASNNWPLFFQSRPCKLFIIARSDLQIMPLLLKHYRKDQKHFLNNTGLFILQDIAEYLKNPLLKPTLFNAIAAAMKE